MGIYDKSCFTRDCTRKKFFFIAPKCYICHIIGYDFYDISNDVQGKIEQFGIHDFFHKAILLMWSIQAHKAQFKIDTIIPLGARNTLAAWHE